MHAGLRDRRQTLEPALELRLVRLHALQHFHQLLVSLMVEVEFLFLDDTTILKKLLGNLSVFILDLFIFLLANHYVQASVVICRGWKGHERGGGLGG